MNFGWFICTSYNPIGVNNSDVQNAIRIGLQPCTIQVYTNELSAQMWLWKLGSSWFYTLLFCIPKSLQSVPKSPQKFFKSCIWDGFSLVGQIRYKENPSTRIQILVLGYWCGIQHSKYWIRILITKYLQKFYMYWTGIITGISLNSFCKWRKKGSSLIKGLGKYF